MPANKTGFMVRDFDVALDGTPYYLDIPSD